MTARLDDMRGLIAPRNAPRHVEAMDVWEGLKEQPLACSDDPSVESALDTSAWRMKASPCRHLSFQESPNHVDLRRIAADDDSIDASMEAMTTDVERLRNAVAYLRVTPGRAPQHNSRPSRSSQSAPTVYE